MHEWDAEVDRVTPPEKLDAGLMTVDIRGIKKVPWAPSLRKVLFAIGSQYGSPAPMNLTPQMGPDGKYTAVLFKATFCSTKRIRMKVEPSATKRGALSQLSVISPLAFADALNPEWQTRWGHEHH